MKPVTTDKSGEIAYFIPGGKSQYYPGKKSFMKRRRAKADRRNAKLNIN